MSKEININGCGCPIILIILGLFAILIIRDIHDHKERMIELQTNNYETTNLRSSDPR